MMRHYLLRQFYKAFMINDARSRKLHLCSAITINYISKRSINEPLVNAKQIQCFSNTSCVKEKTNIMSGEGKNEYAVDYNDVLHAQKDNSVLIVDVREQSEINETGKLPGSIHIPMGNVVSTLNNLSEKDFEKKFNKPKPGKNTKIILSCRSGKRSGMIQEELQKIGYENVYNYLGGWLDWENHQK